MSAKDTIVIQRCGLSAKELNEFLFSYPIPLEFDVILPTSTQTIFEAPHSYVSLYTHSFSLANLRSVRVCDDPIMFLAGLKPSWEFGQQRLAIIVGDKEMAFRNFIYTEDDDDLAFLPKEPSPGFGESLKAGVFVVHPRSIAARIKERKCKTRGGSSRPPVKRKLAFGSSSSRAVHAKTSASKDDAPFLSISDHDEAMKEPFDLLKAKGYRSSYQKDHSQARNDFATAMFPWLDEFVANATAPIETLLSKKPPMLQKPTPSKT
ncbi:hypothetical protein Tco_0718454 [Tanacetum coccineum]